MIWAAVVAGLAVLSYNGDVLTIFGGQKPVGDFDNPCRWRLDPPKFGYTEFFGLPPWSMASCFGYPNGGVGPDFEEVCADQLGALPEWSWNSWAQVENVTFDQVLSGAMACLFYNGTHDPRFAFEEGKDCSCITSASMGVGLNYAFFATNVSNMDTDGDGKARVTYKAVHNVREAKRQGSTSVVPIDVGGKTKAYRLSDEVTLVFYEEGRPLSLTRCESHCWQVSFLKALASVESFE